MRVALLALALSLAACGDPANNAGGMDGGGTVDAGSDEALAWALCRLDVPRPTTVRDWGSAPDPEGCADAGAATCSAAVLAMCPAGQRSCCLRREHCGEVWYVRCP